MGLVWGWLFEPQFKAHHEVDPSGGILLERGEDGFGVCAGDVVLLEDLVDLFFFVARALDDLALFAVAFRGVVLGVSAGGEISAKAHGDGAGGDLGDSGENDEVRGGDGTGETGGEGEGNGEAVGEANDHVADDLAGLEVMLVMVVREAWCCRLRVSGHGNSLEQATERRRCAANAL